MVQLSPHTEGKMLRYQFFKKSGRGRHKFLIRQGEEAFPALANKKTFSSHISIQERKR